MTAGDSDPISPEPSRNAPRHRSGLESARIGVLFLVSIVGLYLVRWWGPVDEHVVQPFTLFIATLARVLLGLFGSAVTQEGTIVSFGGVSLNILDECNGVPAIIVFLSAILAYPAPLRSKLLGLAIGLPAIFVLNEVRVLSLFLAVRYFSPEVFQILHEYAWQFVIILFAVLLWLYWAERFVPKPRPEGPPA